MTDKNAMGALVALALINGSYHSDRSNKQYMNRLSADSAYSAEISTHRRDISTIQTGAMHLESSVYNMLFESGCDKIPIA